jgi:hypothetical protein
MSVSIFSVSANVQCPCKCSVSVSNFSVSVNFQCQCQFSMPVSIVSVSVNFQYQCQFSVSIFSVSISVTRTVTVGHGQCQCQCQCQVQWCFQICPQPRPDTRHHHFCTALEARVALLPSLLPVATVHGWWPAQLAESSGKFLSETFSVHKPLLENWFILWG